MNKLKIFSVLVFILAFFLRFHSLGEVPVGFHRDEAFLGYNAYSILKTGKDISGNLLPLHLNSFLFSPAGYSYFSIPFIALLGLDPFSVRFASALFGSLTVVIVYFLTKSLFEGYREKQIIALLATLIFSVSPWHINLSRTATENTVATFFVSLGILTFLYWLKKRTLILVFLSVFSFSLTLFLYQAPRAFLPIFLPFLFVTFAFKTISKKEKVYLLGLFLLTILLPVILIIKSPSLSYRVRMLNIFNHPLTRIMVTDWIASDGITKTPLFLTRVFHNKLDGYAFIFSENFLSHLSPQFLFFDKGFPDRYRIPSVGLLYLFEIVLLFTSITYIVRKNPKIASFLIGWILISFVGSALTFDDIPNLQRTLSAAPAFSILSGFGFFVLYSWFSKNKFKNIFITFSSLVFIFSVGFYLMQYYSYGKIYRPWYRQDGYKELVKKVNLYLPNYKKAVITNRETAPTIFFLFFNKYNPALFQSETKNKDLSKSDYVSFSKYTFTDEECPLRINEKTKTLTGEKGILYIDSSTCDKEITGTKLIDIVKRVDGSEVFRIYKVSGS